jgi:hypothetical protein
MRACVISVAVGLLLIAVVSATNPACTIMETLGCFADCSYASCRILETEVAGTASGKDDKMTHEYCAMKGKAMGFGDSAMCGVEFGGQCFCGDSFHGTNITKVALSECATMKCPGNSSEACGDSNRMLVFRSRCPTPRAISNPSQSRCTDPAFSSFGFCNSSLTLDTRIADLVSRMTQSEKISIMSGNAAVPRLGVAAMPWGEGLHGVASSCYTPLNSTGAPILCPSSFPHALALAASFNRSLWHAVGDAISTEARALNNLAVTMDFSPNSEHSTTSPNSDSATSSTKATTFGSGAEDDRVSPLMMWAPNLNPYRDPR